MDKNIKSQLFKTFESNNTKYKKIDDKNYFIHYNDIMQEFVFDYRYSVPEDEISVFLYKMIVTEPDFFRELIKNGRKIFLEHLNSREYYKQ